MLGGMGSYARAVTEISAFLGSSARSSFLKGSQFPQERRRFVIACLCAP